MTGVMPYAFKSLLSLVTILLPVACSPQPQTHPLDTAPIPANVRILEEPCSPLGAMMCGAVSILSVKRLSNGGQHCIVYVEPNGERVEQVRLASACRSPNAVCDHDDARIGIEILLTSKSCEILLEARL